MMSLVPSMVLFLIVLIGFQCVSTLPVSPVFDETSDLLHIMHQDGLGPLTDSYDVEWTTLLNSLSLGATPCSCSEKTCGCCQHIEIKELDIDTQACANVTFLSTEIGVKLTLSLGGKVLFDKTVSIKNPDPVCVKFADNKLGAELCVELYNLAVSLADVQGCARLKGKLFDETVATVDLGCFKIPFKGPLTADDDIKQKDFSTSVSLGHLLAHAQRRLVDAVSILRSKNWALTLKIGVKLTLSLSGEVLFDKTVSIKNPDPVCVKLADNKLGAELCVELYLAVSLAGVQGCVRLEGKLIVEVDFLGCFGIPFKVSDILESIKINSQPVHQNLPSDNSACSCSNDQCECCERVTVRELDIDSNICVKVQFVSASIGVSLIISVDGRVIFKKTLSFEDPPPICIHLLSGAGDVCIEMYNMNLSLNDLSGCALLEVKVLGEVVVHAQLGCFRIPLRLAAYGLVPEGAIYLGDVSAAFKAELVGLSRYHQISPELMPVKIMLEPNISEEAYA